MKFSALNNKRKNILAIVLTIVLLALALLLYVFYLSPSLQYRSAYQSLQAGEWNEAEAEIKALIAQGHADPELYNDLSVVYRNLQRFEEALSQADQAITLNPDLKEAYFNRGRSLKFLMRTAESLAAFEKALEIDPDYPEALSSACEAAYMLYDIGKIERYCSRSLILQPENREVMLIFGLYQLSLEKYTPAREIFLSLTGLEPESSLYWYFLGVCQYGLRLDEDAIESFTKAHKLSPRFDEARQMLEKMGINPDTLPTADTDIEAPAK